MAASGHEERFPPTRLNAGCGFRKETIAGMRRNGRDAPIPALEEGVSCELVSGNPDFNVRKKENGRPKAKFDQYLDLV